MSEELKPCPFCGGSAEMKDGYPYVLIKCRDCSARTMHPVKAEAVEQWNARVEETKLAKVRAYRDRLNEDAERAMQLADDADTRGLDTAADDHRDNAGRWKVVARTLTTILENQS